MVQQTTSVSSKMLITTLRSIRRQKKTLSYSFHNPIKCKYIPPDVSASSLRVQKEVKQTFILAFRLQIYFLFKLLTSYVIGEKNLTMFLQLHRKFTAEFYNYL